MSVGCLRSVAVKGTCCDEEDVSFANEEPNTNEEDSYYHRGNDRNRESEGAAFGKKDYNVVFTSRNQERAEAFSRELFEKGIENAFFQLDVTDEDAVNAVIDKAVGKYGQLDSIVNNAGVALGCERWLIPTPNISNKCSIQTSWASSIV